VVLKMERLKFQLSLSKEIKNAFKSLKNNSFIHRKDEKYG